MYKEQFPSFSHIMGESQGYHQQILALIVEIRTHSSCIPLL